MKLIYVAGPYRGATIHATKANIRRAELVAEDVVRAGHYPIVPHLCTQFMDGLAPDAQFLAGALEALRRCDEVWLVDGWEGSSGTLAAIPEAQSRRLPAR